ncbi:rhodanese-like domain-containing protein [Paraglaciecola aestuariivivens]
MLSYQEYVASVQQQINEVEAEALEQNSSQFSYIIDIREEKELATGLIPNAISIPRGMLEAKLFSLKQFDNLEEHKAWLAQQPILLYCASGARSALAAKSLQTMGCKQVYSLKGGINQWRTLGYATSE